MYNVIKQKRNKFIRILLILPLIVCLLGCNGKKNVELEDGNYVLKVAYQTIYLNSDGSDPNVSLTGDNVLINDYRIDIGNESGKLVNARIKKNYMRPVIHYWCFYDYNVETLEKIWNVKKGMIVKANKNSSFSNIEYYLVEVNDDLFLLQGAARIYELIKEK